MGTTSKEILERLRASEAQLKRLNRVYLVLSSINQVIARNPGRKILFNESCRIAVEEGNFRMAWIGLLHETSEDVEVKAHAGLTGGYLEKLNISLKDPARGKGPTGRSIRSGKPVVCNHIETDPSMAPWREDALKLGYGSSAVFPLKIEGKVIGAINLYAPEADFFNSDEVRLLGELAADTSFALENLKLQEARKMAEASLQESEWYNRFLFESSAIGLVLCRMDGSLVDVNPAFAAIIGRSVEETEGLTYWDITPEKYKDQEQIQIELLKSVGFYGPYEKEYIHSDGHLVPVRLNGKSIELQGEKFIWSGVEDISEQKRAEENITSLNKELQTINRIIRNTTRSLDLHNRLEVIMDEALAIAGLEGGTICLINPDDTFELAAHRATSPETIDDLSTRRIRIGDCLCGSCAKERIPLILKTREEVMAYASREVLRGEDIRFHAAYPFVADETCVGVLCVFTRTDKKPAESSLKLLETIVAQTAVSIQNARLYETLKSSQEKLLEMERLLAETGRIAQIGGWEFDVRTGQGTWTEESARIHDLDPEQETSESLGLDVYNGESRKKIEAAIRGAIERGAAYDLELEMTTLKGTRKWVRTIGQPVWEENQVAKLRGTIQDITSVKLVEDALMDSEVRYRSLFEQSMDAILLTSPDGTILDVNPATCRMFGKTAGDIIRAGRNAIVDTTDPRLAVALQERARKGMVQAEITMISADGNRFPVELTSTVYTDSKEQTRTSMIIRDISERKQAEEALRKSEMNYRSLFENMVEGFSYCKMIYKHGKPDDFIYLLVNEEFEKQTGLKNVTGKPVTKVIPGIKETTPELLEIYGRVALTGEPERFEIFLEAIDMWFYVSVYSPQKEYFVAIFDVITERKRSEELLRKTMNRLIEMEEMLKRTAARQLHDQVGQNLTALTINLSFFRNQLSPESLKKVGNRLTDSLALLDDTIEKIRDIMTELRPSILDDYGLYAALSWSTEKLKERINIPIRLNGHDAVKRPPLEIEYALFRMTQEALHNIVKHAKASWIRVEVKQETDSVCLIIQDDGLGFDPKMLTEKKGIQGFGLTNMTERMKALGGTCMIQSAPGKGTTVILEIKFKPS